MLQVASALRSACTHSGFAVLANHGVPATTIDAMRGASRRFFQLPLEQKMAVAATKDSNNRGYTPAHEQKLDPTAAKPDTKEGYYIGRELPGSCGLPLQGPNQWPPEEWAPASAGAQRSPGEIAVAPLSCYFAGELQRADRVNTHMLLSAHACMCCCAACLPASPEI